MADWDPQLYNRFRRYRAEPVDHILARLQIGAEERIVDLGCGPGENTVELARRTSHGTAVGIDSSPAMIYAAKRLRDTLAPELSERISFALGDIAHLSGGANYTIIFSNAALHWLRGHRAIFASMLAALLPGGTIVVQMPANGFETAKIELDALANESPWRSMLSGVDLPLRQDPIPQDYAQMLTDLGFTGVDCYYETFHHPMDRADEVAQWYRSTGLRPYVDALAEGYREDFLAAYTQRLEIAYGTSGPMTFDFRRLFIWGRRPAD